MQMRFPPPPPPPPRFAIIEYAINVLRTWGWVRAGPKRNNWIRNLLENAKTQSFYRAFKCGPTVYTSLYISALIPTLSYIAENWRGNGWEYSWRTFQSIPMYLTSPEERQDVGTRETQLWTLPSVSELWLGRVLGCHLPGWVPCSQRRRVQEEGWLERGGGGWGDGDGVREWRALTMNQLEKERDNLSDGVGRT